MTTHGVPMLSPLAEGKLKAGDIRNILYHIDIVDNIDNLDNLSILKAGCILSYKSVSLLVL